MVKIGPVVFELKCGKKWKLCCDSAEMWPFSFIWHTGILKRIGISQFWFQQVNLQSQAAQSRQPCVNNHQLSQREALGTSHFWPPTISTYLNRSLKNCHRWLGPWPLQLYRIWWKSVHGANRWNINYISFFIYTPFLSHAPTGQTAHHIFTLNGSNDADSRKGVLFWLWLILRPI